MNEPKHLLVDLSTGDWWFTSGTEASRIRRDFNRPILQMDVSRAVRLLKRRLGPDTSRTFGVGTVQEVTDLSSDMVTYYVREGIIVPVKAKRKRGRPLRFSYRNTVLAGILAKLQRGGVPFKVLLNISRDMHKNREPVRYLEAICG